MLHEKQETVPVLKHNNLEQNEFNTGILQGLHIYKNPTLTTLCKIIQLYIQDISATRPTYRNEVQNSYNVAASFIFIFPDFTLCPSEPMA